MVHHRRALIATLVGATVFACGCSPRRFPPAQERANSTQAIEEEDRSCLAAPLMRALGRRELLVGAMMDDSVATAAPFHLRYLYLAGGIPDGAGPCASCAQACTTEGKTCATGAGSACGWWGCWQSDRIGPGEYLRNFLARTADAGQLPLLTYYEFLHASGVEEGVAEVEAMADAALMARYFADWRFVLQQVGDRVVLLHLEPDLWGYAHHLGPDPDALPAKVAAANPKDCAALPDTVAGVGRCLIAMVRRYAPNAKVGLHASFWATKVDVSLNRDPAFDVRAEANEAADYLRKLGAAEGDFIVIGASDRDAGWYETQGQNRWWDATNQTLPNFHQGLFWAKAISEALGLPHLWWQLPLGDLALPNVHEQWKDNRAEYFLSHADEVAAAHGFGMAFGAGKQGMTTASTDGGRFLRRVRQYAFEGGPRVCP